MAVKFFFYRVWSNYEIILPCTIFEANLSLLFHVSALYYLDEVKNLASYARLRGVLLLPEFDAPGHAAYGWQSWPAEKGYGNLTTCMGPVWKDELTGLAAEPPAGQLNPTNEKVYEVKLTINQLVR